MPEAATEMFPIAQPDGTTVFMSQREAVGALTELAASGIGWVIVECPQILALAGIATVSLWLLLCSDEKPKGSRR